MTDIRNNTDLAELIAAGMNNAAGDFSLDAVSENAGNPPVEIACNESYAKGQNAAAGYKGTLESLSGYVADISAALQAADQKVVLKSGK